MRQRSGSARRRSMSGLGVGLSLLLLAAGCGGGGSKASPGGGGAAGPGDLADLGAANPATGSPVTIGMVSASGAGSALAAQFQKVDQGAQIAVQYMNDYMGGLGGHKVELFICQGEETPAGAQDCANQMVNKGVVAVVQPFSAQGASIVPVLANAKIPFISLSGASQQELINPDSFILSGGIPTTFAALADYAGSQGVKNFSMLIIDGAGVVAGVSAFAKPAFDKKGIKFSVIPVATGTADMTPQLSAAATGGADAIGMIGDVTFCTSFLQGYQSLNLTQPRYLVGTCNDPTVAKAYGDLLKGSIGLGGSSTDTADPDVKLTEAVIQKYGNGLSSDLSQSSGQTSSMFGLITLARLFQSSTGPVDAAAVSTKLSTTPTFPLFLGGGAMLTCDGKQVPILSSLCGTSAGVGVLDAAGVAQGVTLKNYKGQL
jgi:branched-chain amino acid transport system substrate-binding protein